LKFLGFLLPDTVILPCFRHDLFWFQKFLQILYSFKSGLKQLLVFIVYAVVPVLLILNINK